MDVGAQLQNRRRRLIHTSCFYHILRVAGLECGCLLGEASGGEATLMPVEGLTIGIAFRARAVVGGEFWTFTYAY